MHFISFINTYIGNLERVLMNLFAGQPWRLRHRDHLQTRVGEEGEGGMSGESSREAYTLSYVKQMAIGNLLYDSGNSNQGSIVT